MTGHRDKLAHKPVASSHDQRVAAAVAQLVNDAPPLSAEQRNRLALLLRAPVRS